MLGEMVGSYRVLSKLGEGGMGLVYLAEHTLLHKKAVVKMLHTELSTNQEILWRFFNEARSATMIQHPGIVDVFDFGHHPNGRAFILMEFLEGESLGARLRKSRLDSAIAISIGRQIASALGAAHEQGITHRDLKPDNVFLVPDREAPGGARIKVLDFGIAKLASEAAGAVKTRTGAVMGTPSYMAPEQCRSSGDVDHRADIYALGCMLFEMVCGVPPFRAESLGQLVSAHMFESPPAPTSIVASIPSDLEDVILRALAKAPDARPGSMSELAAQLDACSAASSPASHIWANVAIPTASPRVNSAAMDPTIRGAVPAIATTLGTSIGQLASRPPARPRVLTALIAVVTAVVLIAGIAFWKITADNEPAAAASRSEIDAAVSLPVAAVASPDAATLATISIVLDSEPRGAAVIQEHDGVRVGTTPFDRRLTAVAGGHLVYIVKHPGYEDQRVELATDRDNRQTAKLEPLATPQPGDKKKPVKRPRPQPKEPSLPKGPDSGGMLRPDL